MSVEYEKKERVALITINRPRALNAIDPPTLEELGRVLMDFRDDPELWVGIITGAGTRAFSAGADVATMLPFLREECRGHPERMSPNHMRGLELWKPLIAAINGLALGGGLEVALACDLRIASENATFGFPEVGLGIIPGWGGTQRLSRVIPWTKAAEMLLMRETFDAAEAYRIGLVGKVVPIDQLLPTALEWAERICALGPLAVRAAKEAMIKGAGLPLEEGLRLEWELEEYLLTTEDAQEGPKAFVERRKPVYKGR